MGLDVNFANLSAAENNGAQTRKMTGAPEGPAQDSVDAFQKEMNGDKNGERGQKREPYRGGTPHETTSRSETLSTETETPPAADSLLESLFGSRMQKLEQPNAGKGMANAAHGDADAASLRTSGLVDKLVDRILVSEPGKIGTEVRLTVSEKVLPGTEISITKALDGQISVKIISSDPNSFQTLVEAQSSLRSALEQQGGNVRVEVNMSGETDAQENDSRRQSRGYQACQPDEPDEPDEPDDDDRVKPA